jgi:hypothetical protein
MFHPNPRFLDNVEGPEFLKHYAKKILLSLLINSSGLETGVQFLTEATTLSEMYPLSLECFFTLKVNNLNLSL